MASFLGSSSHETFVKENHRWFLGGLSLKNQPHAAVGVYGFFFLGIPQFASLIPLPKTDLEKSKAATGWKNPMTKLHDENQQKKQNGEISDDFVSINKEPRHAEETFSDEK